MDCAWLPFWTFVGYNAGITKWKRDTKNYLFVERYKRIKRWVSWCSIHGLCLLAFLEIFFFFLGWVEYNARITKWNRDTKELKLFPDTVLILLKKKKRLKGQLIPQLPFHKFIRSLIDISSLWKMLYKAFFICVSLAYMAHKTFMFTNSISQLSPDPLTSITDQKQWLQFAWRILNCACEIQSQNAIFSIRL